MNFLKHVMQSLDDKAMGLLGAVLNENEPKIRSGVEATVPKVLDAMVNVGSTDEGREMLWRELRDTDASVGSGFEKHLFYNNSQSLVTTGQGQLDGLLGVEAHQLINSVSREADLGSTSARRLVGVVTPLVFASVANHQQAHQLDEHAMGEVISQQRQHLDQWNQHKQNFDGQENSPLFDSVSGWSGGESGSQAGDGVVRYNEGDKPHDANSANLNSLASSADSSNSNFVSGGTSGGVSSTGGNSVSAEGGAAANSDGSLKAGIAAAAAGAGAAAAGVAATTFGSGDGSAKAGASSRTTSSYATPNYTNASRTADGTSSFAGTSGSSADPNNGDEKNYTVDASGKRLWVPDSAQVDADGESLKYQTAGADSDSGPSRWSNWLWLPLLLLCGGLAYLATYFEDNSGSTGDSGEGVALVADGEDGDAANATGDGDANADGTGDDGTSADGANANGDAVTADGDSESGIAIEPAEGENANAGADKNADDPKGSEGSEGEMGENGDKPAASGDSDLPPLEEPKSGDSGTKDKGAAGDKKNAAQEDAAKKESESKMGSGAAGLGAAAAGAGSNTSDLDADEQVEELLSGMETTLKKVKDSASAKAAKRSLWKTTKKLESLLGDRDQWEDEIEILVDFQLQEGKKMLATKGSVLTSSAVKKELGGTIEKLQKVLETPAADK